MEKYPAKNGKNLRTRERQHKITSQFIESLESANLRTQMSRKFDFPTDQMANFLHELGDTYRHHCPPISTGNFCR
jgi:hypothetical protein